MDQAEQALEKELDALDKSFGMPIIITEFGTDTVAAAPNAASVTTYVDSKDALLLTIHGTANKLMPVSQSDLRPLVRGYFDKHLKRP